MAQQAFDPNQYISKVKGQDYLEVKWRIAWMRNDHPDAVVETDLFSYDQGRAIVRARVTLSNGGSATGWGSETEETFENFIEKAETRAIGRALTALGYGTPGSAESDEFEEQKSQQPQAAPRPTQIRPNMTDPATAPQRAKIQRLAVELEMSGDTLNELVRQHTGGDYTSINKRQASGMIDLLEGRRANGVKVS